MCSFVNWSFQLFFFKWSSSFQFLFLLHLNSDPTLISGFLVKLTLSCVTHTVSLAVAIFYVIFFTFFISLFFKLLVIISICLTDRPNCVLFFVGFLCVCLFFFLGVCVCVLAMLHGIWDLIFLPRMELVPLAVEAWSPNHCTAREFSMLYASELGSPCFVLLTIFQHDLVWFLERSEPWNAF